MCRLAALRLIAACAIAGAVSAVAHAADPNKVLRFAFQFAEATFDPAIYQDQYSGMVVDQILEPMLTYDYLARPAKLVPDTLESMPEISADGKTYTFRIRKGIYFTPTRPSRESGASSSRPTMPTASSGTSIRR